MYGHVSEYIKEAQDWLADAYFLEGAAGRTEPSKALLDRTKAVVGDRDQSVKLFKCGDYLHSQYAMRNAVQHAKGFTSATVAPHRLTLAESAVAANPPTDRKANGQIFKINKQASDACMNSV